MNGKHYQLCIGEVHLWIEQGTSIHLKAVAGHSDPVEMTWEEARELARLLTVLAEEGEEAEC